MNKRRKTLVGMKNLKKKVQCWKNFRVNFLCDSGVGEGSS